MILELKLNGKYFESIKSKATSVTINLNFYSQELTVVDEADGGDRVKTGAHFSRFDLFKTVRQTAEKVLPLFVEAEPQIQLQLSLNCPACRAKSLLTRQLWAQITTAVD